MFDREGKYNNRFYCSQHFGLPGTQQTRSRRKYEQKTETDMGIKQVILNKTPEKVKQYSCTFLDNIIHNWYYLD